MRSYQDMHISGQQSGKNSLPLFSFNGSGQQLNTDIHAEKQFFYGFIMLIGEYLRRGHHTCLITIIQSQQHTHQSNQCFSASDIPLQKAVHLPPAAYVVTYFLQYPFLSTRQLKRKILGIECVKYIPYLLKNIAPISSLPVFGIPKNIQLHIKQFLEFETVLRSAEQIGVGREMNIPKRFRQGHQMMFRQQFGRKSLGQRLLYLLNDSSHHFLYCMGVEEAALHFLRRIVIRLQTYGRKFQFIRFVYIGMRYVDTSVEHGRFTENDILFVKFIFA